MRREFCLQWVCRVDEPALRPVRTRAGQGKRAADAGLVRRRLLAHAHVAVTMGKLAAVVVGTRPCLHPVTAQLGLVLVCVAVLGVRRV